MQALRCFPLSRNAMIQTAVVVLICTASLQSARAEDDFRAGALLQVPFSLNSWRSPVDFSGIRVGLTCQYAQVEDDVIIITRKVTNNYLDDVFQDTAETTSVTGVKDGNQAYGVEGNVMLDILDGFTPSVELLAFYGTNDIQGALGGGYDFASDFFFDAKVMFPYSEIGVRFPNQVEIYGGLKTLGSFDPQNDHYRQRVVTNSYTYSPVAE